MLINVELGLAYMQQLEAYVWDTDIRVCALCDVVVQSCLAAVDLVAAHLESEAGS